MNARSCWNDIWETILIIFRVKKKKKEQHSHLHIMLARNFIISVRYSKTFIYVMHFPVISVTVASSQYLKNYIKKRIRSKAYYFGNKKKRFLRYVTPQNYYFRRNNKYQAYPVDTRNWIFFVDFCHRWAINNTLIIQRKDCPRIIIARLRWCGIFLPIRKLRLEELYIVKLIHKKICVWYVCIGWKSKVHELNYHRGRIKRKPKRFIENETWAKNCPFPLRAQVICGRDLLNFNLDNSIFMCLFIACRCARSWQSIIPWCAFSRKSPIN